MMRKIIGCLALAVVCMWGSSSAWAACPDTTYACIKNVQVGAVTLGNCGDSQLGTCKICGGDYGQPARTCNLYYSTCNNDCIACFTYEGYEGGRYISERRCYDKNGQRQQ